MNWGIFVGAFAGSLIELVEILAVVLVVGRVAGWRNALVGAGSAIGLVALVALLAGGSLTLMPLRPLEVVAGLILLAFGGWWALSVTKYYGGLTHPEDDEDEQLARQLSESDTGPGWSFLAALVAFKSSLIESFEVAIIVVGLGLASGSWSGAVSGMLVAALGLVAFAVSAEGHPPTGAGKADEVLRRGASIRLRRLLARRRARPELAGWHPLGRRVGGSGGRRNGRRRRSPTLKAQNRRSDCQVKVLKTGGDSAYRLALWSQAAVACGIPAGRRDARA